MFPFHPYYRPIPKTILKIGGWFAFTKKLHIVLFQKFQRYMGNSDILKLLVCFLLSKINFHDICREKTDVLGNKRFITLIKPCYNFCFVSAVVLFLETSWLSLWHWTPFLSVMTPNVKNKLAFYPFSSLSHTKLLRAESCSLFNIPCVFLNVKIAFHLFVHSFLKYSL